MQTQTQALVQEMEKCSFSCACICASHMLTEAKQVQCKRKDKNTLSIGSIALRRKQVESKMASSILDEKLAESARKYPVLCYKRCADKLKKTLA